jgi:hypothetical protein
MLMDNEASNADEDAADMLIEDAEGEDAEASRETPDIHAVANHTGVVLTSVYVYLCVTCRACFVSFRA